MYVKHFVATLCYYSRMSKKPSKMGRPPLENSASVTIPRVRVRPDQLMAYKAASKRSKKSFSAWMRDVLDKASQ